MVSILKKIIIFISFSLLLSGCARDLSSDMYVSSSTMNLTLEGKIISSRKVLIKENDKLQDNKMGMVAGGVTGAVVGAGVGGGHGNTVATVGGALAGATLGALVESELGKAEGFEYVVKVDVSKLKNTEMYYDGNTMIRNTIASAVTSGLITVVQSDKAPLAPGQKVFITFSNNRTRVVAQ
jgi:outer membrane lipoprotein SlyB